MIKFHRDYENLIDNFANPCRESLIPASMSLKNAPS